MSRIFNGTTARLFNAENSDITAYPATIFFYAKFTSVAAWEKVVRLHNTTNDFIGFGLNNVADMTATNNQSVNTNITDATNIPLDTWLPYVGVFTGTDVTLYSQGSDYNTAQVQTWAPNFGGEEEITIGSDIDSANFLHGKLAHLTIWSDELSAPNIASLIGGADPWGIDNANIERYWSFTTDSLTDAKNSSVLANTDTTTDSDSPTLDASVYLEFIEATTAAFEPSLSTPEQIVVDHISTTIAMYEPTGAIVSAQQLDPDFISSGEALYEPFGFNYDLIESTLAMYQPTASAGVISVDYISTGNELFEPLAYPDQLISVEFISSGEALYEPTATVPVLGTINVDFISSGNELYEPDTDPDLTAPNLTLPTALFISTATCVPTCFTDEDNGTMGYVIVISGVTAPSAAQVLSGLDGNGDAAVVSDTKFVTQMGTQTFQVATGLDPRTEYDLYFSHIDDGENTSSVAGTNFGTLGTDNQILNPDIITRLGEVRKSKRKKPIQWDY